MSRRSVERDKAFEIYKDHNGDITNRKIAELLSTTEKTVSEKTVGGWKTKDSWVQQLNGVLQNNERSTPPKKTEYSRNKGNGGAPKGNRNAVGNPGNKTPKWGNKNAVGHGPPKGNDNAVTHGFFRKHFPEEVADLAAEIMEKNPIDMLWENITIQYTAIIRAQRLMFVKDKEDMTKELRKNKVTEGGFEEEWEIQFAWDKHATLLNAQSRAMSTLSSLIRDFDKLANIDDERRAKMSLMNAQIDKIRNELKDENPAEDKIGQYLDKLEGAFKK
ncbi:phage terminase small subunit [Bacillus thuringiensis]|uniref:phage terminase small subunit n=1 Tax=Bacillus thuringiensis TaxID=1428 RepID=UPI002DBA3034|nr:phage terminase small subunit [Bacillus thuringiensis]MEC3228215.1 phage terminase small subunit [Bacillus thuringiensis]MEC3484755.1 phage terminase small subunit [Bacillus thuringiensis]MED2071760.1 phage terminase small subunit [Bacillus thuringiensis]MED2191739.1 phage terminase small subunit [Bacillus thuringiensis]MED2213129.1 phage terminase small subunit [Bacillus thuringiensis]